MLLVIRVMLVNMLWVCLIMFGVLVNRVRVVSIGRFIRLCWFYIILVILVMNISVIRL